MKLLGRKKDHDEGADISVASDHADESAANSGDTSSSATSRGPKTTGPKGRPTPKRNDATRSKKGPVVPAPMTSAEARARRKKLARPKLSREERKAEKAAGRARMAERRERMMAGDEAYLLPRDQGPVRRYVRDVVDARRNLLGLFMPSALALLFAMFAVPQLQLYMSPAMLVLMALMTIDGIILARKVSNLVDVKFPNNTEGRWKLGLYAAGRASQMRRMRAPRPKVERGASVD
ncbi:alpha-ribazole-5'-phosphate phosphatase [Mycobacterium pseudoshottsii JCM 15466]|uniref:DUF3043 domain-containing protein n=1 Tax=Mycobacterium pseudoshottsii TaxID=265949 RepID=A0A9N7QPG9_9MYCO|nr:MULTISPECIES: DUF3043 domain-containing protein [Mycobacterium]EPQ47181.1 Alpha-ribazole-5'-phosphate phosphatase [Mycobacterium sp. 012931]MBC9866095.1 CblZ, a non-orthologous displasment for Alpha-ribazole-5'-phosphate phosphatase [Mycobacterium pseudoshottsii]RFZ56089.1 hypothetical protein DL240490_05236 [Mycobacterium marinum]BBA88773.1 hypothetical protein MPSD_33320 [Mycobacterium pseudoshottsii JCM 15466]BDN83050.1 hypothetical protein NJB1907Z4_C32650 [Mycobacterium pseudoshottsii]